uniref:ABC transmembrane type-1 domain-containing protein n=1 Tax=Meloidogyne hapla TaxID=6305 RepID=A0A1I8B7Y0_MELHA
MSLPHITSVNLLISQTELCSTPALLPIYPNSTFEQIVSPCLAKVLIPSLPIIIALTAFIALCVQNFLFRETLNGCRLFIRKLVVLKALISFFAAFISLIDVVLFFAWPAYLGPSPVLPEQQNSAFIGLALTLCLLIVYAQCICFGVVSSGFLHLAWFLRFASLIPDNVLSFANSQRLFNEVPSNYSLISQFLLAILMTFLLCWADSTTSTDAQYQRLDGQEGRKEKKQCPESSSSALNCLFFWYTGQMIWRGLRGSVDFDDLWTLDKCFQSGYLRSRFHRIQRVCAGRKLNPALFLFRLFLCVWEWNCLCVIAAVFVVLGNYANAMFLRLIVLSVTAGNPIWLSLTFMVLLFFTDFGDKLVVIRRDFASFRAYLNLRSVLTTQIFDKMIRLSSASHIKYSVGEIQNYLNNDVFHVRSIFFDVCDFVNCPLTVLIAFFGLYMELGVNAFYGLIILVVVFPVNYALTKLSSRLEDKLLKIKDERLKLINDVLSGMRVLKLYAWEESMEKLISKLRKRELYVLRQTFLMDAAINVSFQLAPLVATLISFYGYTVVQGNPLRPDVAFVSLLFFGMLRISIYTFPRLLTDSIKAWVSSKRLVEFLNAEEKQPSHILRENQDPSLPVVSLRDCSFSWTGVNVPDPNLQLQNISLEVQPGELIGIVGRVGSGKSSLLSAIIGEMERMEDKGEAVVRAKTVGYAPQQPWIQNKTLRSNVLFDSPFNESKYTSVINACSMGEDLKLLPAGDFTEIGEKGINLSGGQKARVALARAVYMDAELYVLDDTLSAVDAHVGAAIFANVIGEKEGEIYAVGTLKQLTEQKEGPFADLIREFMEKKLESQRSKKSSTLEVTLDDEEDSELSEVLGQLSGSPLSESLLERRRILEQQLASSEHQQPKEMVKVEESGLKPTETQASHQPSHQSIHQHRTDGGVADISEGAYVGGDRPEWTEVIGRLTKEEELATGIVSRRIYLVYFRSFGILLAIIYFILTFFGVSTSEALSSVWLAKWSSAAINNTAESLNHLLIYGGFNLVSIGAYSASTYFHGKLVSSLFHSPMSFFDQTPMGRIMNRLSYDIARIDENIPWAISYAMSVFAEALNSLIAICFVIPVLVVVVVPLLVIFLGIIHFYNVASVHFRRLTSKATSSNCSFFQDSNLGADSIRVFNVVERFRDKSCYICDFMNESLLTEIYSNRWLQSRLDFISDSAVFICVFVAIIMADYKWISLGVLAMVINNGYIFTGYLGQIARVWRESEVQMVCIERVTEYINNEREPEWNTIDESRNWPPSGAGHLQFKDVCLRYRNELDLVLNNVNFDVRPGEKVGIVGRTGAGKSSLTLALFRIVDPCSGKILINGIDICTLGLHDLRGSLTIIPQDPVLFCGTLRLNLDPFDEYKDASLWEALEKAHLAETIREIEGGLDYKVAESGANLSVGQRQLVCMARAVLRQKTCILVLDEATAAIDPETDSRIQLSIRSHFKKCTILTIAHRLNTIIDYDRVLVMDAGKVAEFDSPNILLKDSDSLFFKLAKQAGISQSEKEEI